MQYASSAARTCAASRSASEYTAIVRMPISWHAAITRMAISPRLATKTLLNIAAHPARRALLKEGPDALLPLGARPQARDGRRRRLARLLLAQPQHRPRHHLR